MPILVLIGVVLIVAGVWKILRLLEMKHEVAKEIHAEELPDEEDDRDIQAQIDTNLNGELSGTYWILPDGRQGRFLVSMHGGERFVLVLADGSRTEQDTENLQRVPIANEFEKEDFIVREVN